MEPQVGQIWLDKETNTVKVIVMRTYTRDGLPMVDCQHLDEMYYWTVEALQAYWHLSEAANVELIMKRYEM